MIRRSLTTVFFMIAVTLAAQPGVAQGKGKGHGHNQDQSEAEQGKGHGITVIFTVHDRETIRDYYRNANSNLPPGLAKRNGQLPPGLQKHLERDGTLPPGLQKKVQPFPEDLERRLPRLPDGYQRVTIGVDVLIRDRRTQRIVDVIHDILRH
ncbi:MAG TPA: hypothetical protein VNW97_16980 [Candidatus Saccharimonadales bacterium]|jgi:hypothetical protein|nr:hypothetical protein [Candidatus Saccharimonadales bacterium]